MTSNPRYTPEAYLPYFVVKPCEKCLKKVQYVDVAQDMLPQTPNLNLTPSPNKKERKKDKNLSTSKKKMPWPKDFQLTLKMRVYASAYNIDAEEQFDFFHDNALAKNYMYLDWEKAWQVWCRSPYQVKTEKYI